MSNAPRGPRHEDCRRPARNDRLPELAAFCLGYEPHALGHEFMVLEFLQPTSQRAEHLRGLPIWLGTAFHDDERTHYLAMLEEALHDFGRISGERPLVSAAEESVPGSQQDSPSIPPSTPGSEPPPSETREQRWFSERHRLSFMMSVFGESRDNWAYQRLGRLAKAIGGRLPIYQRNWFDFGEMLGRALWQTGEGSDDGTDIDYWSEALVAAGHTDFHIDKRGILAIRRPESEIPEQDDESRAQSQETASSAGGHGADQSDEDCDFDWGLEDIEWLVQEVTQYLESEPRLAFKPARNFLWFLGAPVSLSPSECAVLRVFAESEEAIVTRVQISSQALQDPAPTGRRPDQYLQQIINKIAEALKKVRSPYLEDDDKTTREWLREQLFPPHQGVGWYRGPLFRRLVVE